MVSQPDEVLPVSSWPEEPAFSRRRPRFGGSVQSAVGSSPAVTRCEPTSDASVAAAPSIRTPHWFVVGPLVGARVNRVAWPSLLPPIPREENVRRGKPRTPSIAWCLFSTRSSSAPCRAAGASKNHHPQPAVTISRVCSFGARLRSATPHAFALEPFPLPFSRRPFRCDGGVSDPNARSRRRPAERARRHLEPDARPNDFCNCIQRTDASASG